MKFSMRSTIVAVIAVGTVAGFAAPASAIVGGQDAIQTYSGMAALSIYFPGEGTALCGGVLVSPNEVLTAAHCESDDQVAPNPVAMPAANTVVRIGSDNRTSGGFTATGKRVDLNPGWAWGVDPTQPVADLAIVTLDRRVPTWLMPIGIRHTHDGDRLRLIGWGLTQFPPAAGATAPTWLQQNDTTRQPATTCVGGFPGAGDLCVGGGACYGDSGSPALRQVGKGFGGATRWETVGVASRETDETTCNDTVYTDPTYPAFRNWIIDVVLGVPLAGPVHPFGPSLNRLDPASRQRVDALKAKQFLSP